MLLEKELKDTSAFGASWGLRNGVWIEVDGGLDLRAKERAGGKDVERSWCRMLDATEPILVTLRREPGALPCSLLSL